MDGGRGDIDQTLEEEIELALEKLRAKCVTWYQLNRSSYFQFWASYAALAAASGVIGNLAYDLLKRAIIKAVRRQPATAEPGGADAVCALAKLATCLRCVQLELPVPGEDLEVLAVNCSTSGQWTVHLYAPPLRAEVVIPAGNLG